MKHRLFVLPAALFMSFGTQLMHGDEKHEDIPQWVVQLFSAKKLDTKYDFAFALNPSYLSADFNGDGKIDVAVLVKQRATGKLGIAVIHAVVNNVVILGAGTPIGNGGDDFAWMDSWQVYSKKRAADREGEMSGPRLRGDALLVSKSEAASALIYWNGKRYVWLQQGD
ncbi:MAG TPA: hypothetical protein VH254_06435 [Candidatus Udaeobacter sp.]|jgi:hypothetical protein|nr:hypothetical protein [Candidatus Udaeobacter sp.]